MSKEILKECKRLRPVEFQNVTVPDITRVTSILWGNIAYILKNNGLLAINNYFLFRPNLNYLAKNEYYKQKEKEYKLKRRVVSFKRKINHFKNRED